VLAQARVASGKARAPVRAWVQVTGMVMVMVMGKALVPGTALYRVSAMVKGSPANRVMGRATQKPNLRSYLQPHRRRSQQA
jgi:hypothetical protein